MVDQHPLKAGHQIRVMGHVTDLFVKLMVQYRALTDVAGFGSCRKSGLYSLKVRHLKACPALCGLSRHRAVNQRCRLKEDAHHRQVHGGDLCPTVFLKAHVSVA
ncbi:hypothetical protein PM04_11800 [Thalassobacter sp. 16PALIMAR09]|nr:hypothetical protein PM04_11800 [Thalassobacter sp. 16PALIMAR09]